MLGNYLGYLDPQGAIPKANAQSGGVSGILSGIQNALSGGTRALRLFNEQNRRLGIIAVVVEEGLLQNAALKEAVYTYAQNAQERVPHSKAVIMSVGKNESTFKIATTLERMYYEGMDSNIVDNNPFNNSGQATDNNQLTGVVLIGDVPLPVVKEDDGSSQVSLYPYTDFYRKKYIYDHNTQRFEFNREAVAPNPEVWHGVIMPPGESEAEKRQRLRDYFEKNRLYSEGDAEFEDFSARILYSNFPAMEKYASLPDYQSYKRYMRYLEEIVFSRFNRNLFKHFIADVSSDLGSEDPIIDAESIDNMTDISTKFNFENYLKKFNEAFQVYLGRVNEAVSETGRWGPNEVDTPESLIAMRDTYMEEDLRLKQFLLEEAINDVIDQNSDDQTYTQEADVNFRVTVLDVWDGNGTHNFPAFIDGKMFEDIDTMDECGMYRGQYRRANEDILENNSVYVEANRMYNSKTSVDPEEEKDIYEHFAGCVFNNAVVVEQSDSDPKNCIPKESYGRPLEENGLFDYAGSMEVKRGKVPADDGMMRCREERVDFKPRVWDDKDKKIVDLGALGNTVAGLIPGAANPTVEQAINRAYSELESAGAVSGATTFVERSTEVVKYLDKNGGEIRWSPAARTEIIVTIDATTKDLDGIISHREPTNEAIKAITRYGQPRQDPVTGAPDLNLSTPSVPADGIRSMMFLKNGQFQNFDYPNFFRVDGVTPDELQQDLLAQAATKDAELGQKLGVTTNVTRRFILNNVDVLEPMTWRALSPDQKLEAIIPKYVDRDSVMPVPPPPSGGGVQTPPQIKPNGYEVLHVNARGDALGFQFGLNRVMKQQEERLRNADGGTDLSDLDIEGSGTGDITGGNAGADGENICGDPTGVDIWDWPASVACWYENEIAPAEKLFSLAYQCTPRREEAEDEEEIDVLDAIDLSPNQVLADMDKKSLVLGEEVEMSVEALTATGQRLLGYIDTPVEIEVSGNSVSVERDSFNLFTGEAKVKVKAESVGLSTITVSMEGLQPFELAVRVYDSIGIRWNEQEKNQGGRSIFEFDIQLEADTGTLINNVDTEIFLYTENPSDGEFSGGGKAQLRNGKGTISLAPTPGKTEVTVLSNEPYEDSITIYPTPVVATQLVLQTPSYLPMGESNQIKVLATNDLGTVAPTFNETVTFTGEDSATGEEAQVRVNFSEGRGTIRLNTSKETGDITLTSNHTGLRPSENIVPVLVRVDEGEWETMYPENLFASFIGFPAGDITQDNYFGGTHLFNGRTQAVYSQMKGPAAPPVVSISPNYKVSLSDPSQRVDVSFPSDRILVEAFDTKRLETLMAITARLNLTLNEWDGRTAFAPNTLNVKLEDGFELLKGDTNWRIMDEFDNRILTMRSDKVQIADRSRYRLTYNDQSQFDLIELILEDDLGRVATLYLNLPPMDLDETDFRTLSYRLKPRAMMTGNSTRDPKGLILFDPAVTDLQGPEEFYGIRGEHKYISLFAGGSTAGDSVKNGLPSDGILLGDPTIRLRERLTKMVSAGGEDAEYMNTAGQEVYRDHKNSQITSITGLNFNRDIYDDVAMVMEDGRIRLLQGGPTEPALTDRGDIAFLADGALSIESFDFENDGYEDLVVSTEGGRLAILNNRGEIVTRTDQQLNVGNILYDILKGDMDNDGYDDLVTSDSLGDIRIFYYNPNTGFPEDGELIDNFGFGMKTDENLSADMKMRYTGIPEPESLEDEVGAPTVTGSFEDAFSGNSSLSVQASQDFFDAQNEAAEEARQNPAAGATDQVPTLPWPEGDETSTYFAPMNEVSSLSSTKRVVKKFNPDDPGVDIGERLVYTITLNSSANRRNVVLADQLPDSLNFDPNSVTCDQASCRDIEVKPNGVLLFFNNFDLTAGQTATITYEAEVKFTPRSGISLANIKNPSYLSDQYMDILVSPAFNPSTDLIQLYSVGRRSYAKRSTTQDRDQSDDNGVGEFMDQLAAMGSFEPDENSELSDVPFPEGLGEALDKATGNDECFIQDNGLGGLTDCRSKALDDVADAISKFNCMGGGCFPMPWNQAFLVPPAMAFPIFAFPTTLPSPIGPLPFIWPGSILGAASIPGPIMSLLRFYISPTLTGGIGMAMCWGPYLGSAVPPPPLAPIPYPPPIGNCIVTALPVDSIFGGLCSAIAEQVQGVMDVISSGVNKINSVATNVNNSGLPVSVDRTEGQQGAGGLEISLGVNLGNASSYDPPTQSFSNIHLPTFDSITGVISGWMERQSFEITSKLFTLPTLTVYLPDFKNLFAQDWDRAKDRFETWRKNMNQTGTAVDNRGGLIDRPIPPGIKETTQVLDGVRQAAVHNLSVFQDLYDVVGTLPLVNLTEKTITVDVPWISSGEVIAYIQQLQQWLLYYEREYDRVKDKWEAISCPDITRAELIQEQVDERCAQGDPRCKTPAGMKALQKELSGKAATQCMGRQAADRFGVNFQEVTDSVKENIEVLNAWLDLPKQLIKYRQQLAEYVYTVACYLEVVAAMLGGWQAQLREQIIGWAEVVITIWEIINNIQELFDVFVNFDSSCATCTNERFANPGWWALLGLILPDIPIFQFPKIPNLVIDFSNIDAQIDIELPVLNVTTHAFPLPPLPYIRLPDLPDFNLLLQIPPLPVLPGPPDLPPLPDLPPIPTVQLPTLPPPFKLPDVGAAFGKIIPIIDQILNIWCLVKKGLSPVPESMLGDQITMLTNRPAYLTPLDLLKIKISDIALFDIGFNEIRVETLVYIGLRINIILENVEEIAEGVNNWSREKEAIINEAYGEYIIETERAIQGELDDLAAQAQGAVSALEQRINQAMQDALESIIESPVDSLQGIVSGQAGILYKLLHYIKSCAEDKEECGKVESYFLDTQDIVSTPANQTRMVSALPDFGPATPLQNTMLEDGQDYGGKLSELFAQLAQAIEEANNAEMVDARVLRERMGLPEFELFEGPSFSKKLAQLGVDLKEESERMDQETASLEGVTDLYAFAGETAPSQNAYRLAAGEPSAPFEAPAIVDGAPRPTANSIDLGERMVQFKEKTSGAIAAMGGSDTGGNNGTCTGGLCLPESSTGTGTNVVPQIDYLSNSEAVFLDRGQTAYSDGNKLYLKNDLSSTDGNTNQMGGSVRGLTIDELIDEMELGEPLMEAVNLFGSTLTENAASSFNWKPVTHPELYGYGIEIERSILGFDRGQERNGLADITVILLPKNADGSDPEIRADGQPVRFDSLVTSLGTQDEAIERFGVRASNMVTGIRSIEFPTIGGVNLSVNGGRAVYIGLLTGSAYSINMENGYYHAKMSWFDRQGNVSTRNRNELFSPQPYVNSLPPVDIAGDRDFYMPIYKGKTLNAENIFIDVSSGHKYYWFVDGATEPVVGKRYTFEARDELVEIPVRLVASKDIDDDNFEQTEKNFKMIVYPPPISLRPEPLRNGVVAGTMENIPEAPGDNLKDIPFSLFRQRWGVWKNLGLLIREDGDTTNPPLDDATESYFSIDAEGRYRIEGLYNKDKEGIRVTDPAGETVAEVQIGSGRIDLISGGYELLPLPASVTLPTRVAIIESASGEVVANVYYIANRGASALIREEALSATNIRNGGVTLGDANPSDDIIANNIPDYGPSFAGGAAIFNETPPQKNIALVDRDGTIRMMQAGYKLEMRDSAQGGGRYIFRIVSEAGAPIFDVYIHANFGNIEIRPDELMSDTQVMIGMTQMARSAFAGLRELIAQVPETKTSQTQQASTPDNPFPDLNESHPYYKEIIELYKQRIVSGYGDGSFRPDEKLGRAEFVKIALGVTNCYDCQTPTQPQREKYSPLAPFPDVKLPAWYYFCISIAKELGMVTGYGDGFFRPEQTISRAEGAAVLLRQSGIEIEEAPEEAFFDVPDYAWYKDYVYTAVQIGLIKNSFGYVNPEEKITRGEFAFMSKGVMDLQQCKEKDEDGDGLPDWWEMENNMDPLFSGDALTDVDFDGLTALEEFRRSIDPNDSDTDDDGLPDRADPNPAGDDLNGDGKVDANDDEQGRRNGWGEDEAGPGPGPGPRDTDNDGIPDVDDDDDDNDGIPDEEDPDWCPCIDNPNQNDSDGDGIPDPCDIDIDSDYVPNNICIFDDDGNPNPDDVEDSEDNCVFIPNPLQEDFDFDGVGNACEQQVECPCVDNPNQNDTDGDGIIDTCDDDIDNDTILNPICIFDDDGNVDPDELTPDDGGDIDNCIFDFNTPQTDSDLNGVGDVCEVEDLCPPVPEDMDGVDDHDGCPEVDDEFPEMPPGVYVTPGPACGLLDYMADLVEGDIIMTAITDLQSHDVVFSKSNEVQY